MIAQNTMSRGYTQYLSPTFPIRLHLSLTNTLDSNARTNVICSRLKE